MTEFNPLTSYKSESGKIIVIHDMTNEALVRVYRFFMDHYRILEKMSKDPRLNDPGFPSYLSRFAQVRDLLKEEIKIRKLKMKDFI